MEIENTEDFKEKVEDAKFIINDPRFQGLATLNDRELAEELRITKQIYLDAVDFLKSIGELQHVLGVKKYG